MWMAKLLLLSIAAVMIAAEPPAVYGPPGYSSGFRPSGFGASGYGGGDNGPPQPFNFHYEVKDPQSGNDFSHHANSDGRRVQGEYQVLLPDGRRQIVKYTADDNGYVADVQYEGQPRYPQTGSGGYSGGSGGYSGGSGGYSGGNRGGFGGYNY